MPQSAGMTRERSSRIEEFVIQHIHSQNSQGEGGVSLNALVGVLRAEFFDSSVREEGSAGKEKTEMRNAIRMMVTRRLICQVEGSGPIGFMICPEVDMRRYVREPWVQPSVEVVQDEVAKVFRLGESMTGQESQIVQSDGADVPAEDTTEDIRMTEVEVERCNAPNHTVDIEEPYREISSIENTVAPSRSRPPAPTTENVLELPHHDSDEIQKQLLQSDIEEACVNAPEKQSNDIDTMSTAETSFYVPEENINRTLHIEPGCEPLTVLPGGDNASNSQFQSQPEIVSNDPAEPGIRKDELVSVTEPGVVVEGENNPEIATDSMSPLLPLPGVQVDNLDVPDTNVSEAPAIQRSIEDEPALHLPSRLSPEDSQTETFLESTNPMSKTDQPISGTELSAALDNTMKVPNSTETYEALASKVQAILDTTPAQDASAAEEYIPPSIVDIYLACANPRSAHHQASIILESEPATSTTRSVHQLPQETSIGFEAPVFATEGKSVGSLEMQGNNIMAKDTPISESDMEPDGSMSDDTSMSRYEKSGDNLDEGPQMGRDLVIPPEEGDTLKVQNDEKLQVEDDPSIVQNEGGNDVSMLEPDLETEIGVAKENLTSQFGSEQEAGGTEEALAPENNQAFIAPCQHLVAASIHLSATPEEEESTSETTNSKDLAIDRPELNFAEAPTEDNLASRRGFKQAAIAAHGSRIVESSMNVDIANRPEENVLMIESPEIIISEQSSVLVAQAPQFEIDIKTGNNIESDTKMPVIAPASNTVQDSQDIEAVNTSEGAQSHLILEAPLTLSSGKKALPDTNISMSDTPVQNPAESQQLPTAVNSQAESASETAEKVVKDITPASPAHAVSSLLISVSRTSGETVENAHQAGTEYVAIANVPIVSATPCELLTDPSQVLVTSEKKEPVKPSIGFERLQLPSKPTPEGYRDEIERQASPPDTRHVHSIEREVSPDSQLFDEMFFTRHSRYASESEISEHFPIPVVPDSQTHEARSPVEPEKESSQVAKEDQPNPAAKLSEKISVNEVSQPEAREKYGMTSTSQFESELRAHSTPRDNIQLNIEARPRVDPGRSEGAPVQKQTEATKEPSGEADATGETLSRQEEVDTIQPEIGAIPRSIEVAEKAVHEQTEISPRSEVQKTPAAEVQSRPDQDINLLCALNPPLDLTQYPAATAGVQYKASPMEQFRIADQVNQRGEMNKSPQPFYQGPDPNARPELLEQKKRSGSAGALQRGISEELEIDEMQDSELDRIHVAHLYSPTCGAPEADKLDAARLVAQQSRTKSPGRQLENHSKLQQSVRRRNSSHRSSISPDVRMQLQVEDLQRGPSPELGQEFDPMESTFISGMDWDSRMDLDDEPYSSQPIRTPSRKRRRVNEIAASENDSECDPSSPERSPDTTFHRPSKRLRTPHSEPRRQHAFSRRVSPQRLRARSPTRASISLEDMPAPIASLFKHEKKPDNSPSWIKEKVEILRSKYPDDQIELENGIIICVDCDKRRFVLKSTSSIGGIYGHFNSQNHRERVANRLEGRSMAAPSVAPSIVPSREQSSALDYTAPIVGLRNPNLSLPHESSVGYSHQEELDFQAISKKYHEIMQAKEAAMSLRGYHMEHRYQRLEKWTRDQIDQVEESVAATDRVDKAKHDMTSERISTLGELMTDRMDAMVRDLKASKSEMVEVREDMQEIKENVTAVEEDIKSELQDIYAMRTRDNNSTMKRIEDLEKEQTKLNSNARKQEKEIERANSSIIEQLTVNKYLVQKVKGIAPRVEAMEKAIEKQNKTIDKHKAELATESLFYKARIHNEAIQNFESRWDLQQQENAKHLAQQNQSQIAFRKAINDQMQAQQEHFAKRVAEMQRETKSSIGMIRDDCTEKIDKLTSRYTAHLDTLGKEKAELQSKVEQLGKDGTDLKRKLKSLEAENAKLKKRIDVSDQIFPVLFSDTKELREFCEVELVTKVKKLEEAAAGVEAKRTSLLKLKEKSGNASPTKEDRAAGKTSVSSVKENAHVHVSSSSTKHQLSRTTPNALGKENEHMAMRKDHHTSKKTRSPLGKPNVAEMSE